MTVKARRAAAWMFRDRSTGKIVVAQRPNPPLTVWLVCLVVGWLTSLRGGWGTSLSVVGTVALVIWASDEVLRGVNPWRRLLGASVLIALTISLSLSR